MVNALLDYALLILQSRHLYSTSQHCDTYLSRAIYLLDGLIKCYSPSVSLYYMAS